MADHRVFPQPPAPPIEAFLMPIRQYRRDPRSEPQRRADDAVLSAFERGGLLHVAPSIEKAAIDLVTRRQTERRQIAASLGVRLGLLRRSLGVSQRQLAVVLGTRTSNVSRLENGRDGGVTVERLLAVEEAIRLLAGREGGSVPPHGLIHVATLDRFRRPVDCLEAS